MAVSDIVLTAEGRQKLIDELEWREGDLTKQIVERIKTARDFGDLSENSEYDDAKEEQAKNAARIAEIMEFAVDPACRSRGIGKEMFARACADARAAGCVQIELATNQRRTGAHHFYAREGMRCSHYSFTLPLV